MNSDDRVAAYRRSTAPYFIASPTAIGHDSLTLETADAHHLAVRRIRTGDVISVGDGAGRTFEARIEVLDTNHAVASILSSVEQPPPAPRITVLQGLAKGAKVDWAIEKMVELGVDRIAVFAAGRSVPVWDEAKASAASERWDRVARAASKQSRRAWLPKLFGPLTGEEAVQLITGLPLVLVADPGAGRRLREVLPRKATDEIALVVGPEGGLTPDEAEAFEKAGATTVDLGDQILRTETAGLAFAAAVMFAVGRFG